MERLLHIAFWLFIALGVCFSVRSIFGVAGKDPGEELRNWWRAIWLGPLAPRELFTASGWRAYNTALACVALAVLALVAQAVFT
jgi:hypothetical protein